MLGAIVRRVQLGVAVAAAVVGLWILDRESIVWAVVTAVGYGAPLVLHVLGPRFRFAGSWLAVFLVAQTGLSLATQGAYRTLRPNLRTTVDVQDGVPGVSGPQSITTDPMGFRVTRPIDYRHKAGPRIFAIGGSTTEQIYLDDRRTWTHLIQEGLSDAWRAQVEVINTGVSGLRAFNHLATLQRVAGYQPDLAVFLLGLNDWNHQIIQEFARRGYPERRLDPNADLRERFFRNSLLGRALTFWRTPSLADVPPFRVDRGEYFTGQRNSINRPQRFAYRPATVEAEYAANLDRIGAECRRQHLRCMFVTQPTAYQPTASDEVRRSFWMTPPNQLYTLDFESMVSISTLYNDYLRQFVVTNGHQLCDATPEFEPTFENFYDDCHFNLGGAAHLARVLQRCIETSPRP